MPAPLRTSFDPQVVDGLPDRLILFDGDCVFCSGWVSFILPRDAGAFFRFAAIQSPLGRAIAARLGIDATNPTTNVVIVERVAYFKSDSAFAALKQVPGWRWTQILEMFPKALRDWLYDSIARNRYRLYGRKEQCLVPQPEHVGRFLERVRTGGEPGTAAEVGIATASSAAVESQAPSLFRHALGQQFEKLPAPIRHLHQVSETTTFSGVAKVDAAANLIGAAIARLFDFPQPASDVDVQVAIEPDYGRETWYRRFGASRFSSVLNIDARTRLIAERFGFVQCKLDVRCNEAGIDMHIVSARFGGVRLPQWLVPWSNAFERVDGKGRFTFDVEIGLRGVGRLVRYQGWLVEQRSSARPPAVGDVPRPPSPSNLDTSV